MGKLGIRKSLIDAGRNQSRETIPGVPKRTDYGQAAGGGMGEKMALENFKRKDSKEVLTGYSSKGGALVTSSLA